MTDLSQVKIGVKRLDYVGLLFRHLQFAGMGAVAIRSIGKPGAVLYDVKYILPVDSSVDGRL
jgi:UDP-N-acetyl-D-glucosamine/UDP-N-acetyl-D-galactosamine dehydrogenase